MDFEVLDEEQLKEFEEIYLTPKNYSVRIAWKILRSRHPNEQISSVQSFRRALTKNFSVEYIKKRRSESLKLPELRKISSVETDKITYEKVSTAFDDYLKTLENKQGISYRDISVQRKPFLPLVVAGCLKSAGSKKG